MSKTQPHICKTDVGLRNLSHFIECVVRHGDIPLAKFTAPDLTNIKVTTEGNAVIVVYLEDSIDVGSSLMHHIAANLKTFCRSDMVWVGADDISNEILDVI